MTGPASLRRLRADLLADTFVLTRVQQSGVDAELATNPIAKAEPEFAAAVAAAHGWPVAERKPARGLAAALARHLEG